MQPGNTMISPHMAPANQYQQYAQQSPAQQWVPQPQYQVPPQQQSPAAGYYYQQQQQQSPATGAPPQQMYQHSASPNAQAQPAGEDAVRSLWIGDLQYWMDEQYLLSCFAASGEVVSAKVIRNKQTGLSEHYGFIEFANHAAAERALQTYNGTPMPSVEQTFRMNWASMGAGEKRDDGPEYTIFVGDLAADVTDYVLQETFMPIYPSVKGAKVVTDRMTGRSKGYGFVRFGDESEQIRAMTEMNGRFCSTRAMRIGSAANKQKMGGQTQGAYPTSQGTPSDDDPNNTTIFVGNLDSNITEDYLRQVFGRLGQLLHVKIPAGKRCGFVQFADRRSAEEAILLLNGTELQGQSIRLSWGRSPSNNKQTQVDPNQYNGGYCGYNTPGYQTYGYGSAAPQDPNLYYSGHPGYGGNYPQQQPQ